MRCTFFILILCLFSIPSFAGDSWFKRNQMQFAVGLDLGLLTCNDTRSAEMGIILNAWGITMNLDLGLSGGSSGEHKYGKGDVAEAPWLNEMTLGYSFPIFSNESNVASNQIICYITPLFGVVNEVYEYEDDYYGKSETAYQDSYASVGAMLSLRVQSCMYSVKVTNHGGYFGISYCF